MPPVRTLSFLAVALFACTLAARELQLPKPTEKWIGLQADEFRIVSSAPPAATVEIARDLLRMRAAIAQVTSLKPRSAKPTRVYIFPNERSFAVYRDAVLQREKPSITGVFSSADPGQFILLPARTEGGVDRIVFHEMTHQLVQNTATVPLWLDEGIAEYYSTFRADDGAVLIGRPIAEHVKWLRTQKLIPLRELFAVTTSSPEYNEEARSGVFYAQSWALVHYLMTDTGRRAKLGQFLTLLAAGRKLDDAFTAAFSMQFADLEKALRDYVRGVSFKYTSYAVGEIAINEPPQPVALPHDVVLQQLGHLLAYTGPANAPLAERFLKEAVAANPRNGAAYADLGRVYDSIGRRAEADAAYAQVLPAGGRDAERFVIAARGLASRQSNKDLARARTLFARATELDPQSAMAWSGLGATYIGNQPNRAEGIAALEKSLALAPGNEEATFYLAQLYANEGRHDEARTLARPLAARTKDASIKSFLTMMLTELDRIDGANRITTAVNEAISKANARRYEEALAILDAVIPTIDDEEMLKHTRDFRTEIAAQLKAKKK
ncbi:MAG TPA: tetratricopeptide repeat protein [Thermoanaerobaculia bacterium]|jgi:tetratricopeptide (TPR) repeat protein